MQGYVLSAQEMKAVLLATGAVFRKGGRITDEAVKPSSLECELGDEAFEIDATFLPEQGKSIREQVKERTKSEFSLSEGGLLEVGKVYAIPLRTSFDLTRTPDSIHGKFNPRSRIGRLDLFLRVCLDGVPFFDKIPPSFRGDAFVFAEPCSFPVIAYPGVSVVQARFMVGDPVLSDEEIMRRLNVDQDLALYDLEERRLYSSDVDIKNGMANTLDLTGKLIGFKAKTGEVNPINLKHTVEKKDGKDVVGTGHKVLDYFDIIRAEDLIDRRLVTEQRGFYILQSLQILKIPPNLCADIAHSDASIGEFRSHYAGFFDAGFEGTMTLELRSDNRAILRHGQPICRTVYERMKEKTEVQYGAAIGSAHFGQRHPNPGAYFNQTELIDILSR